MYGKLKKQILPYFCVLYYHLKNMHTVYFCEADTQKGFFRTFRIENDFIDGLIVLNVQTEEDLANFLRYLGCLAEEFKVRFSREGSITLLGDEASIGDLLRQLLKDLYSDTPTDDGKIHLKKWSFSLSSEDGKKSIVFIASGDEQEWVKENLTLIKKVDIP